MNGYVITFADVMTGIMTAGIGITIFLARNWLKGILETVGEIKKQNKENYEKVNQRIDRIEDKTEGDIANIKKEISNIKGDFATTFVLREDFFRSMNGVEDRMRSIDGKIDKLLLQKSGKD